MVWHQDGDDDAETSLAEMTVEAGFASPPHRHGNCEERVFVLGGAVTLMIDGVGRELSAGESWRVPRGSVHHVLASSDGPATLLVVWSAAHRQYEEVVTAN